MQEKNIISDIVRVRFAPAPSGMMHSGNVRTALLNYIFARQKKGKFVLRIEDTDALRNFDPNAEKIIDILNWLGLDYDEGPIKIGPYKPYFQSQRSDIYKRYLDELINKDLIYRCFCTPEELEKKRERQIAAKLPPRYDRTCLKLSQEEIKHKLDSNIPFVWRVKVDSSKQVSFFDLAKKTLSFELKNFSDYPITRNDGSFTFIFANCVDDIEMKITHVFRGEDHVSNTVDQLVLYEAFKSPVPKFWHMPMICDIEGKKLSKRCFGFSVSDMRDAGFLPEALCNYLAIVGGSFENEIQSLNDLIKNFDFENMHSTGHIKYDAEKLKWMNHKWISLYSPEKLAKACKPFLVKEYLQVNSLSDQKLIELIKLIQSDIVTLVDSIKLLKFYFIEPEVSQKDLSKYFSEPEIPNLLTSLKKALPSLVSSESFLSSLKNESKEHRIKVFQLIRLALTGSINGPSIHGLIDVLGSEESKKRIEKIL